MRALLIGGPHSFSIKEINAFVDPDGSIHLLHDDDVIDLFPQSKIKSVRRVSEVEFDRKSKKWTAKLNNGSKIASHRKRNQALEGERKKIDQMIKAGQKIP